MTSDSRLHAVAVSLLTVLALASCQGPPIELELCEDLVALVPFAQIPENTNVVDEPAVLDETRRLFLPYGRRIDFHLQLMPGAVLRAERLSFSGEGEGRMEITLATDDGGEQVVAALEGRHTELEYRLADDAPLYARLSLLAESDAPSSSGGGAIVTAPSIWEPAQSVLSETGTESGQTKPEPRQTPNIIIYMVDTLRPDHLGAYGYETPTSPHLDRFAEQAVVFEYAVGQAPWTRPSVASIFTGMTPMAHGTTSKKHKLDTEIPTLASILSGSGYAAAAVISNPNVSPTFGFDRGFDDVFMTGPSGNEAAHRALEWLESYNGEKPFLLYVHTSEPHQPYLASQPYRDRFAPHTSDIVEIMERNPRRQIWQPTDANISRLRALYDAEIAENDAGFGELVALLKARDLYDSAVILYVSDHGEEFYEHKRWGHGRTLGVDQLNVALLIKFPEQTRGSRVAEAAQHVDILPTLLDLLGLPVPSTVEGRSLIDLATGSTASGVDTSALIFSHNRIGAQYSVLAGDFKLIQRKRHGVTSPKALYNWRTDSRELENLLSERPIHAAVMTTLIERKKALFSGVAVEDAVLDDTIRDELRALGYLQ